MRAVMKTIFESRRKYATLPLFEFMEDEIFSPRERLGFYPCMARFILDFGDLNKNVMRDERSRDPLQALINKRTREDDHHWPWYLEDFTALGFDRRQPTTDVYRQMYSDRNPVNRALGSQLAHLLYGASPVEKLVIIKAIEETGSVLFAQTVKLARRVEADERITLRYLGDFHFSLETGRAMSGADHQQLSAITLDAIQQAHCLSLVRLVFRYFEGWTHELLTYAVEELANARNVQAAEAAYFEKLYSAGEIVTLQLD